MKKLTYIFLSLLVLAGCTGTSRQPQLVAMDSLLLSRPDSALTLLRGMSFTDKADRMYHYLLLADACNKCYDTLPSDTILQEVADYYDRHGTPNEQVRAHYLLGCAYRDMGEAPHALDCYQTAISRADTTSFDCNYRLLMSVYGQMAELFYKQNLPQDYLEAINMCGHFYLQNHDTISYIKCLELQAKAYNQMGNSNQALNIIRNTQQLYRKHGYPFMAVRENSVIIYSCIQNGELTEAQQLMREYELESRLFDNEGNIANGREGYYYIKGSYFLKTHQLDSAEHYMRKLLKSGNEVDAYRGLSAVYEERKSTDSIIKYARLYEDAVDSQSVRTRTEAIHQMASMYNYQRYQQIAEHEARVAEKAKVRGIAIFFVCLLIISIGILSYLKYKRKKQTEIQQLNDSYIHALLKYNNLSVEHERLRQEDNQLINDKQLEVEELRTVINNYQSKLQRDNIGSQLAAFKECKIVSYFRSKTKITIRTTPPAESDWIQLIKQFSQDVPSAFIALGTDTVLTPNELRLCILMLIGFKNADITILFNSSVQSISNIKARANYKLFGDNSASGLEKNLMRIAGMV